MSAVTCSAWAVSCIAWRLEFCPSRGTPPWPSCGSLAVATPAPPQTINPDIPPALSELIVRLLAKDPKDRPQSAHEVVSALAELAQERTAEILKPTRASSAQPTQPQTPAPPPQPARGRGRRLTLAATAGVLLLGIVLGVVFWPRSGGDPSKLTPGPSENKTEPGPAPLPVAATWEPGPAEDVLPGLVGRPARLDGLRRWQVQTVAPSSEPRRLAWSSDGKWLAVGMTSGEIRVYDDSLRPVRFLYGHEGEITALSWTRNGRLASGGDRTIRLWEPDGSPGPVMRDESPVLAVAWRADGTLLASGNEKGLIRVWQPDGSPERVLAGHTGRVLGLSWSPDGKVLASASDDKTARLWSPEGKPSPVLTGHTAAVTCVSWSPDGQHLATGGHDKKARLWAADGQPGAVLNPEGGGGKLGVVDSVSWSPDGQRLATANHSGQVQLWSGEGKPGLLVHTHSTRMYGNLCAVAWSPAGGGDNPPRPPLRLASCCQDSIRLWDAEGKPGPVLPRNPSLPAAAWSPDGQKLASGGDDRLVRLWAPDGQPGPVLVGHKWGVVSVSWSPDGQWLASGGDLRTWKADGTPGSVLPAGQGPVAWSPDGQLLAARIGGALNGLRLLDARTGPSRGPMSAGPAVGTPRPGGADSQRIAMVGFVDHTRALIRRDGTVEQTIRGHTTHSVSWSPDGRHLAVGTVVGTELRTSDGEMKSQFGDRHSAFAVCWSPDSKRLASGGLDGALQLWDLEGKAGPACRTHIGTVLSLSWARQGNRLASSGNDGTLRVCAADTLKPLWTAAVFPSRRTAVFSPAGQVLHGHPATADEDFVYVVQTDAGRFELYTPTEFRKKALQGGQPLPLFAPTAHRPEGTPPSRPVDDTWIKLVRAKPAARQRDEILTRLKELNPGYYEPFEHKEANGRVVSVTLPADRALRDLSPLRVLANLEQLTLSGKELGTPLPLADLKPLSSLKLKELTCTGVSVTDLTPLASMPLQTLTLRNVPVADLGPLRSLPLKALTLRDTRVADLKPLRGIASLENLDVRGSRVTDLKPVQGMLLKSLGCDVEPKRDAAILRAMPTLTSINEVPTREFLRRRPILLALEKWLEDVTALPFEQWVEAVAALPAEKQLAALDVKLAERNAITDINRACVIRATYLGGMPTTIEDGVVTKLWLDQHLRDVSPVRALTRLRGFRSGGSAGKFADLSPLKGLQLTEVVFPSCGVSDLTPLAGMPLQSLRCDHCKGVKDLTPLKGISLTSLNIGSTGVADLSPLEGMPLTMLNCERTKVTDLAVLRGLPLKELVCDFKPERDAEILRSIKTLEKINGKPAKEFWKDVDAQRKKP